MSTSHFHLLTLLGMFWSDASGIFILQLHFDSIRSTSNLSGWCQYSWPWGECNFWGLAAKRNRCGVHLVSVAREIVCLPFFLSGSVIHNSTFTFFRVESEGFVLLSSEQIGGWGRPIFLPLVVRPEFRRRHPAIVERTVSLFTLLNEDYGENPSRFLTKNFMKLNQLPPSRGSSSMAALEQMLQGFTFLSSARILSCEWVILGTFLLNDHHENLRIDASSFNKDIDVPFCEMFVDVFYFCLEH